MQVLRTTQCFNLVNGSPQFCYSKVLLKSGNNIYCAHTSLRIPSGSNDIDQGTLENITFIPSEAYCPLFTLDMTKASDPLPPDCYVKRPNLIAYQSDQSIHDLVLQDIQACEKLKRYPHKNIACYYGCQVSDGRVTGLCFKTYSRTLMDMVNPGGVNKRKFPSCNTQAAIKYLPGIESGIRHMHSLNLVHNDINPNNIMIDTDADIPVIIDFDSCLPVGSSLVNAKRTPEWHDTERQTSDISNDLDALAEMGTWLSSAREQDFRFK